MDHEDGEPVKPEDTVVVVVDDDDDQNRGAPPSPKHHHEGGSRRSNLKLAYNTIGVVFGGLTTSPLYVYPSMNLKNPSEDDFLGIYGIMFWTLTLIGVLKYAIIALKADDHGEGGTFALYSLLCRNLDIGLISSNRINSKANLLSDSGHRDSRKSRVAKFLEDSTLARRFLLSIAMLGMCMLIGDGVLTPSIAVLSAIVGIKEPFPKITQSTVQVLSAVVLIALFLLQRFGTSKVSFLFSPIMLAWTITTPLIGTYDIIRYYPTVFKAVNPLYIFRFFLTHGKEGWLMLSGIVLCITGTEALFADLGHFNRQSIRWAFIATQYPSLVLTYAGQTAYLIKYPHDLADGFYKAIPKPVYWPMFVVSTLSAIVASQSLISATYSVVKQSVVLNYFPRVKIVHTSNNKEGEVYSPEVTYVLMVLCGAIILIFGNGNAIGNAYGVVVIFVMLITTLLLSLVMITVWRTPIYSVALFFVTFFVIEGVYLSAVLTKVPEGGWIPFAISFSLAFIMFGWFYGRQRKMEYESTNKIGLEKLGMLLSDPDVQRVRGMCFFYTNTQEGLTPVLGHFINNMKSLHQVTVFITLRYFLVPKVEPNERVVIRSLGFDGIYGCTVQYGYSDFHSLEEDFVAQVSNSLREFILSNYEHGQSSREYLELEEASKAGVIHIRGKTRFYIDKKSSRVKRFMLGAYELMHSNCRSSLPTLGVSLQNTIEVGMLYES